MTDWRDAAAWRDAGARRAPRPPHARRLELWKAVEGRGSLDEARRLELWKAVEGLGSLGEARRLGQLAPH